MKKIIYTLVRTNNFYNNKTKNNNYKLVDYIFINLFLQPGSSTEAYHCTIHSKSLSETIFKAKIWGHPNDLKASIRLQTKPKIMGVVMNFNIPIIVHQSSSDYLKNISRIKGFMSH